MKLKRRPLPRVWALIFLFAWLRPGSAQELSKLPYVPTPQIVVDEMLKMANVTAKDFVVDLGSGDGRMIITAAKNFKANGLGVDIDKKLVDLSNKQAKADGVEDRAKFVEQDMFKADIGKATVVTLYVLPDFMEKLRPKLLAELKPGARIVAHDYHMSEWYPDRHFSLTVPEKVKANGTDKAYLYLWIVPSIVRGDWRMEFDAGGSARQLIVLDFVQQYQMINATAENILGTMKFDNAQLRGEDISFDLMIGANLHRFTGKVSGDKMEGTAVAAGGRPIPWRASKLIEKKK
ncbi:MAG TPA: class I SAM-dependent methyltransferase [Candidatus Binatia bacterium]|nr:class I SAM-dependent methyltransferase [Candidatus Binatia bacterium]